MAEPKADRPRCDTPGCGVFASIGTKGDEKDIQGLGRKALPNLNVCPHHENWPFSEDAQRWVLDNQEKYKARGAAPTPAPAAPPANPAKGA